MADKSAIEWTDATWNPVRGCTRVSPGCGGPHKEGGCYAEKIAARFSDPGQPFHGFAERTKDGGRWTGKLALIDDMLMVPLRWKKPRRVFVNSMSDLFHESLPDEAIDRVFAVMALSPQHTFQVLTKRAARMQQWFANVDRADDVGLAMLTLVDRIPHGHRRVPWPLPNVWLGVSCERQQEADQRIPLLLQTPAVVRFISAEPLLGPIDLRSLRTAHGDNEWTDLTRLDWVIVGGESGPHARPMHPDWARKIRDDCRTAGVAFFFKQWGQWLPMDQRDADDDIHQRQSLAVFDGDSDSYRSRAYRVGKKAAGRLLDGRTHDEFPATSQAPAGAHDAAHANQASAIS